MIETKPCLLNKIVTIMSRSHPKFHHQPLPPPKAKTPSQENKNVFMLCAYYYSENVLICYTQDDGYFSLWKGQCANHYR